MSGKGTCKFTDKRTYKGQWRAGKMCGKGRMYYANGSTHTGMWADNMRNGPGTFVGGTNKKRQKGEWADDKFVVPE
jgi:hypothetical protein